MGEIRVESFGRDGARAWKTISRRIREIELECFGTRGAFSDDELRVAFNRRGTVAVLLWDVPGAGDGVLIGYTQAEPRDPGTFYIANTAITKSHQGRGLVRPLMERLYADVRAAGGRFIERDAAVANGYADKIVRFHAVDVLEAFDHDSPYGRQRFIRMRVPRA
jgi:ribosomal protein S18 acetylase RimI-like enzyme